MDTDYNDYRFMGLAAEHESESDGYAYAYTKGHEDGMGDEVIYRPRIATDKGRNIYKKILKQKAEDFQKMTPSEFVPFDQMQEELGQMWDETTAPLADAHNYDYEPSNEPSNANFSADTEYKRAFGKMMAKYDLETNPEKKSQILTEMRIKFPAFFGADTIGSPSPSGPSSVPEPAEATGSEPSNEHMEADSKNGKMAIGITAVGIGIALALGKDRLGKLFDRFNL